MWGLIATPVVCLCLLIGVFAPSVVDTFLGYKLETLRAETARLEDERRSLELREAELLSPERLEKLAKSQHLSAPETGLVVRLSPEQLKGLMIGREVHIAGVGDVMLAERK